MCPIKVNTLSGTYTNTADELRQNASYNESQGPPNQPKDADTFRLNYYQNTQVPI